MSSPATLKVPIPMPEWFKRLGVGLAFGGPFSVALIAMVDKGAIGPQAVAQVIAWGPGLVIVVAMYLVVERWAPRVVASMNAQAASMHAQAAGTQELAKAVTTRLEQDNRDLREIQIMQKVATTAVEALHEEVREMRAELRAYGNSK